MAETPSFEFRFEHETKVAVFITGDFSHATHTITSYKIIEGFLILLNGDRVIATYNHDAWVMIRE